MLCNNRRREVPGALDRVLARTFVSTPPENTLFPLLSENTSNANRCDTVALSSMAQPHTGDLSMKLSATFASLFIAASAALIPASAPSAAPLAGPLSLTEASARPLVQVRYSGHRYSRRAYRSYPSAQRRYGSRSCVGGQPSSTSASPRS